MRRPDPPTLPNGGQSDPNPLPVHAPPLRFIDGRARTLAIVVCGEILWLLLIGLVRSSGPTKECFAVLTVIAFLVAVRCGFSFVLILTSDHVIARSAARTRRWRYSELRSALVVTTAERRTTRAAVVFIQNTGHPCKFTTLDVGRNGLSTFDAAVAEINTRIWVSMMRDSINPS